jgi:hypothetical protein
VFEPGKPRSATTSLEGGGKAQVNANQLPLICHDQLKEFDTEPDSLKRVLVGGKGTGKSTALARKAVQCLDNKKVLIPGFHPYVIRIEQLVLDDNFAQVYPDVQTHHCWVQIWKLVLCSVVIAEVQTFKNKDLPFGQQLGCPMGKGDEEFFNRVGERIALARHGRRQSVSPVLQLLLERHFDTNMCQKLFTQYVRPALPAPGAEPFVMLIDQIDESLSRYRKTCATRLGQTVWEAAQTAIIDAIAELGSLTSQGLQVFAAIRTEAFRHFQDYGTKNQSQISSICVDLSYSSKTMEEIFLLNIGLTEKDRLCAPEESEPIKKFLGVSEFSHPYVRGKMEPALSWLSRHTFGSPRDLVWHGGEIYKCDPRLRSNRQTLGKVINATGNLILRDYIANLAPAWNSTVEQVYSHLRHNFLSKEEVVRIEEDFKPVLGYAPIEYLYRCGMIGIPMATNGQTHEQAFLPLSTPSNSATLPDANFYVIHPCLYPTILARLEQNDRAAFHSHIFVAGQGLLCPARIDRPRVYLIFDYTNQSIELSMLDADAPWNPTSDAVQAGICQDLTITQEAKVGPVLLTAMLIAMTNVRTNYPKVDDICQVIARLVEEGLCATVFGKQSKRQPAVSYFREQLAYEEGQQTHPVTDLRRILEKLGEGLELRVKNSVSKVQSLQVSGLKWTEIRIVVR